MQYRSILVQVDNAYGAKARVQAAVRLAIEHDATLTGAFLKSEATPAYLVAEGIVTSAEAVDAFFQDREAEAAKCNDEARLLFEQAISSTGINASWHTLNGVSHDHIVNYARRHDLTILPRNMKVAPGEADLSADKVAMASGGPVLILPEAGYPPTFGRKILVAWKDSRESARALRDAWPFLAAAEEVHFVTAIQDGARQLDEVMQRHLREHGCSTSRLIIDRDTDVPTGEVIRRHIDLLGADMIVMGLYGRSRLQEFVLGGVSKDMLGHMTMPVLTSH
ncbi:MAG: universal stress protein [Hyphomonadaceae bacterium]|nr:universal stress protein [Hyphomonadaceae bacterium]